MCSMTLLTTAAGLITALVSVQFPSIPFLQQILSSRNSNEGIQNNICLLAPSVQSPSDGLLPSDRFTQDQSIRVLQADRLSKAIQIPTIIGDHMVDPYSEDFGPFVHFQGLLRSLFPLVYVSLPPHKTLSVAHTDT
jgi:Gly-Xaa carboxypeptidase